MNDHVSKPIDPEALFATLLRWIKPRSTDRAQTASVAPGKSAPELLRPSDAVPLQIAGIDTKTALSRTGGNPKRYEMLLRKFAETNAVEEIRSALAADDKTSAGRAAHSLKGAAANLGAAGVAEDAAKVETAFQSGQGLEPAIDSLSISLRAVMRAIRSALPTENVSANGATAASLDVTSVVAPLTRLKKLLANDDGEAADFILEARPALAKVLTGAEISTLGGLVGNFDFASGLKCLSEIAARLSIQLE
jgi:two-component system, sensor histidine kinase and response regulator